MTRAPVDKGVARNAVSVGLLRHSICEDAVTYIAKGSLIFAFRPVG
jgi:hypothetical protein